MTDSTAEDRLAAESAVRVEGNTTDAAPHVRGFLAGWRAAIEEAAHEGDICVCGHGLGHHHIHYRVRGMFCGACEDSSPKEAHHDFAAAVPAEVGDDG